MIDNAIDLDKLLTASALEIEDLQWYDLMSRLGLRSFNLAGSRPIGFIAEHAQVTKESTVLMVGCGAGGSTIHLAEITCATVYGIDIALESIARARALAANSTAKTRLDCISKSKMPIHSTLPRICLIWW